MGRRAYDGLLGDEGDGTEDCGGIPTLGLSMATEDGHE